MPVDFTYVTFLRRRIFAWRYPQHHIQASPVDMLSCPQEGTCSFSFGLQSSWCFIMQVGLMHTCPLQYSHAKAILLLSHHEHVLFTIVHLAVCIFLQPFSAASWHMTISQVSHFRTGCPRRVVRPNRLLVTSKHHRQTHRSKICEHYLLLQSLLNTSKT